MNRKLITAAFLVLTIGALTGAFVLAIVATITAVHEGSLSVTEALGGWSFGLFCVAAFAAIGVGASRA